jgi:4-amino-4-deoxy-L-arabinose transferase-like glycosyltransferase
MPDAKKIPVVVVYGLPIILAAVIKLVVWSPDVTPFNADEAIVALMARHINQGQLMPFFYGQHYMGSLDAILVAALFKVFGEAVWVIRLVQSILYLGTVVTTITLAKKILGTLKAALFAGLLVAIPPVNVTLYTTVSLGGYGEMLLIGNLLLLSGLSLINQIREPGFKPGRGFYFGIFSWSLGAGFAFWVIGLSLVYSLPVLMMLGWELIKTRSKAWKYTLISGLAAFLGIFFGTSPWWSSAILTKDTSILITELLGGAIADVNPGYWLLKPLTRLVNLFVFGGTVITGLRPPWGVTWLMLPLLPFVLIFWLAVFVYGARKVSRKMEPGSVLLLLMGLVLAAGFLFSPYGEDPSGRYFLPLIVPMAILAADLIANHSPGKCWIQAGLLILLLAFNFGGTLQSSFNNPPGLTTQFDPVAQIDQSYLDELLAFLEDQDIQTGYSNYWVAYPLAFLSNEQVIFSPRLPYHQDFRYTERDDRYPSYTDQVANSLNTAYITTRHPALDEYLRAQFSARDISWKEKRIGDYTVYYDLSAPIYVSDIGLGATTQP